MAINNTQGSSNLLTILIVVLVVIAALGAVYLMQDHRTAGERVGDAMETLPKGVGKAVDKLGDQPPAKNVERNLGDAAKKAH